MSLCPELTVLVIKHSPQLMVSVEVLGLQILDTPSLLWDKEGINKVVKQWEFDHLPH